MISTWYLAIGMISIWYLVNIRLSAHLECAGSPGNLGPEKGAPWGLGGACAEGVAGAELDVRVWCLQSLGSLSRQAGCRESGGGRQCGLVICSGSC